MSKKRPIGFAAFGQGEYISSGDMRVIKPSPTKVTRKLGKAVKKNRRKK